MKGRCLFVDGGNRVTVLDVSEEEKGMTEKRVRKKKKKKKKKKKEKEGTMLRFFFPN